MGEEKKNSYILYKNHKFQQIVVHSVRKALHLQYRVTRDDTETTRNSALTFIK